MGKLIEDLLLLSRVTRRPLRRTAVNLSNIARAITAELKKAAPQRPIEFVIANGLAADGDPGLLQVVLENLLNNAWKYSSKCARPRIKFGSIRQPDGIYAFYVRDNGVGFEMAYADKLFGAFQRLHSDADFEGTGIGLATVQRIIHRHGGRVWAEGEVGKGATFYFTLDEPLPASVDLRVAHP
jgi:light-regulated signal transduction histidine kinase (bacteriophytochrome)